MKAFSSREDLPESEDIDFWEIPDILIEGFRQKIELDIKEGKQIHYLNTHFCFAYYDAEIMRSGRYGFYAVMGKERPSGTSYINNEVWCVANSVDIEFSKAGSWDRKIMQSMEEDIKSRMIDLCNEFEEYQI